MDFTHIRSIREEFNFIEEVKNAKKITGKRREIGEMLKGVRVNLMYNADKCPFVPGTKVHYYVPRKIMGLPTTRILFIISGDEVVLSRLDMDIVD